MNFIHDLTASLYFLPGLVRYLQTHYDETHFNHYSCFFSLQMTAQDIPKAVLKDTTGKEADTNYVIIHKDPRVDLLIKNRPRSMKKPAGPADAPTRGSACCSSAPAAGMKP